MALCSPYTKTELARLNKVRGTVAAATFQHDATMTAVARLEQPTAKVDWDLSTTDFDSVKSDFDVVRV